MKRAHPRVEYRLNDLQGMLYAACQLGAWCFNAQKHLFFTTSPHQDEYHMLLQAGGCLDAAVEKKDRPGSPCVLTGELGLCWIAEWVHLEAGGSLLVLLGPMYLKNSSIEESLQKLDHRGLSQHLRRDYLKILGDVPFVHFDSVKNFACMLHFACYEENLSRDAILYESTQREEAAKDRQPEDAGGETENDFERMAAHENMLLRHLRDGSVPEPDKNGYQGELQDFHLKNAMRQVKDNLIIFTAVCARTAIRSGVSLNLAKNRESDWIRRIEGMRNTGDASRIMQAMYADYQGMIRQSGEADGLSRAVRDCRDYIRMNYTKALNAEEIARHCGYTEYYLTRKFARETGMKLTDYIRSVRLDAAKVMLLTSQKDIQQISEELQFGSRSYFDRVFRREIGISPRQYRETRGQGTAKENT